MYKRQGVITVADIIALPAFERIELAAPCAGAGAREVRNVGILDLAPDEQAYADYLPGEFIASNLGFCLLYTSTIASPRFVPLDKTGAKGLAFPVDDNGAAGQRHPRPAPTDGALAPQPPYSLSGIRHSSTKPSTNSTAMDSTPMDELPVI